MLNALGADYRFKTPIYRTADVSSDGELKGDLILVASGDPTLGGRTTPDDKIAFTDVDHGDANALPGVELVARDPLSGLDELAKQVVASGIKKISGKVSSSSRRTDRR
jgi:D-alanyl-D-alanine carboxypeptidase